MLKQLRGVTRKVVSYSVLAREAKPLKISSKRLSDWFGGKAVPDDPQVVRFLVEFLQPRAVGTDGYQERPLEWWLRLHQRAKEERQKRPYGVVAGGASRRGRALRESVLERTQPGWPLPEVTDPFALEVHRAIEASAAGWPDLPVYVVREHDQHLARVVAEAAGGARRMAVLVGDSSTGKTRACWEALYLLRERPEPWRLWHPIDPTRPDAALADLPRIGSYTVVWLNEAQHYLMPADTGLSERIAAGLRTLLHDTTRGAVLILATMWQQYWKEVTARPAKSQPDPYAQARELVNTGTLIHVADEFTPAELSTLNVAGVDPRLRVAAAHAEACRITQYLAGAPELENRYRTAEPVERALMHVAMDARRLGHPPDIARALFERATPGYLDKTTWSTVGGNWLGALDTVLAGLGESVHGIRGPISPNYPQPAESTVGDTPRYRLADYLEQLGRRERGGVYPPESLWTTFTTTAGEPDLLRQLGKQAEDRGRFQHAVRLYIQVADRDAAARHALARLREQAGASAAEALDRLARRDTYVGGPEYVASAVELALDRQDADRIRLGTSALHDLAARQEQAGDDEGAAALYRQAAVRGDTGALCALARLREQAGDGEGAKAWAVRAAAHGDTSALDDLARRRESVGNRVEAEALAVLAADYGNTETLWFLAWLRDQAGDAEAAEALAVQVADRSGNAGVLSALAAMRALAGDTDSAEALHRQGADRGRTGSMRELARLRHRAGYTDDADALYREAIDCGDSNALLELAELRESVGDSVGAGRLLRFGLTGDGKITTMLDFASYGGLVGGNGLDESGPSR